jgi:hypothetical protein
MTRYLLDILLGLVCWAILMGAFWFVAWTVSAWL